MHSVSNACVSCRNGKKNCWHDNFGSSHSRTTVWVCIDVSARPRLRVGLQPFVCFYLGQSEQLSCRYTRWYLYGRIFF